MSEINESPFYLFKNGEVVGIDGRGYFDAETLEKNLDLHDLLREAGFELYDKKPSLQIWTRDEKAWFFVFDLAGSCEYVIVDGRLDYIRFVREWALPWVQFEMLPQGDESE